MRPNLIGLTVALCVLGMARTAAADDFAFAFDWGNIPRCTTGSPNTVPNPTFTLQNVPQGTKFIRFTLTDLDVPQYDHGGGTVEYTGQSSIAPGAFTYQSPCPPNGSHTYEWEARAKDGDGFFSDTLGTATASKRYP
ncbi:MAG: phospholipid-binding protein [Minwuia sp.]|uniref:phospholipid-binding protein n=1 Tax=Minwuia sp. TaxID=2493630 RepID=UPI003A83D494